MLDKLNLTHLDNPIPDSDICQKAYENLDRANNLLDLGCGEGGLTVCLAKKTGKRVFGLDISDDNFSNAWKECSDEEVCHLIECVKGDAHNMDFLNNGDIDAVTVVKTLHHLRDPKKVLEEINRILTPGGKVLIWEFIIEDGKEKRGCLQFAQEELVNLLILSGFFHIVLERLRKDTVFILGEKVIRR